jgi:hypothetical protein
MIDFPFARKNGIQEARYWLTTERPSLLATCVTVAAQLSSRWGKPNGNVRCITIAPWQRKVSAGLAPEPKRTSTKRFPPGLPRRDHNWQATNSHSSVSSSPPGLSRRKQRLCWRRHGHETDLHHRQYHSRLPTELVGQSVWPSRFSAIV